MLVIATLWAVLWLPVGAALGAYVGSRWRGDVIPPSILWFTVALTVWGACSGAVFAFLLALGETGRTIDNLSLARVSLWGAAGCMTLLKAVSISPVLPGLWSFVSDDRVPARWIAIGVIACLGAIGAAGTVGLVRRTAA